MDDRKPAAKKPDKILPKSAGGRKRKSSDASKSPLDALPWIPRAQLESLITSSVNNHTSITTQQLINAMPAEEQWRINPDGKKKKSYSPVKSGQERVNTGSFDDIDSTIMLNILMYLNCKEKYTCVTSVCKGWREFKASMPSLFLDLR